MNTVFVVTHILKVVTATELKMFLLSITFPLFHSNQPQVSLFFGAAADYFIFSRALHQMKGSVRLAWATNQFRARNLVDSFVRWTLVFFSRAAFQPDIFPHLKLATYFPTPSFNECFNALLTSYFSHKTSSTTVLRAFEYLYTSS